MKQTIGVFSAPHPHWVGDGFPVRSLFAYQQEHGKHLNPFLLLDYAGPADFTPSTRPRGVGEHPHRGFETVTLVYQGEVAHRDSTGKGGTIGPGDVQWMTAGSGILHDEFHSDTFTRQGGVLEMVQLWVNLPAKHKMTEPGYQAILSTDIPTVELANSAGQLRVIAGNYEGKQGPARTFSPMNVWDVRLNEKSKLDLSLPKGWTVGLVLLQGSLTVNGDCTARESQLVVLGADGTNFSLEATKNTVFVLLSGEPINEPIAGYGPFVMNHSQEITEAIRDFKEGRFGNIKSV